MAQHRSIIVIGNGFARARQKPAEIMWTRAELDMILALYGREVARGAWRDYAIASLKERAVFSIFRRSSERPLYRIEKMPALRNRQGQYSVVNMGGQILKRGSELRRVLAVLSRNKPHLRLLAR